MIPALMDAIVDGVALRVLDVLKQEIVPWNVPMPRLGLGGFEIYIYNIYVFVFTPLCTRGFS